MPLSARSIGAHNSTSMCGKSVVVRMFVVAVQYEGNRWVESQQLKDAVKELARDNNLDLNINMEQYR